MKRPFKEKRSCCCCHQSNESALSCKFGNSLSSLIIGLSLFVASPCGPPPTPTPRLLCVLAVSLLPYELISDTFMSFIIAFFFPSRLLFLVRAPLSRTRRVVIGWLGDNPQSSGRPPVTSWSHYVLYPPSVFSFPKRECFSLNKESPLCAALLTQRHMRWRLFKTAV